MKEAGDPPESPWENALPPEEEPKPTLITTTQLLSFFRDYYNSLRTSTSEYMGSMPNDRHQPQSFSEYIRTQLPYEDLSDPEGKILLNITPADLTVVKGNKQAVVIRDELADAINALMKEQTHQAIVISSTFAKPEDRTYITLKNPDGETVNLWCSYTGTHSWPRSPHALAVTQAVFDQVAQEGSLLIEIGRPLQSLDDLFKGLNDSPNQ